MDPSNQLSPRDQADHDRSVHDYPDILFTPTEYVVLDVKRSIMGIVYIWLFVLLAFASLVGITLLIAQTSPPDTRGNVAMVGFAASTVAFLGGIVATMIFRANYLIITNERVFAKTESSPFSNHIQNVEMELVQDCSFGQSGPMQILFDYGTFRISTVGKEPSYLFSFVSHPAQQFKIMNDVVQQVDVATRTVYQRRD